MKKQYLLYMLFMCLFLPLKGQLNLNWQGIIDDGANGSESSMISLYDDNGYVYTIGSKRPWGFNTSDLVLAKYDIFGTELWRTFYAGPSGKSEQINDAVLDQNGNLVLCGAYFNVSNKNDVLVMKYSSIGGFMWMDTIDGPAGLYDQGMAVCVDDANNYYFSGYTTDGSVKGVLIKYAPSGQRLWTKTYTGAQQAVDILFYDHHLYLNCMMGPTGSPTHASLMKLDTAGTFISSVTLNGAMGNHISNVIFKNDKIYMLDRRSYSAPSGAQFGVVCADTAMQIIWDKPYISGYASEPSGLQLMDTLLFVSHTEYANSGWQQAVVRFRGISANTGDSLFMSTLVSPAGQKDIALSQTADTAGLVSVLITYELAPNVNRFLLARFNSAGVQTMSNDFYDVPGFGEYSMHQVAPNTIVWNATVYDSIANNTNISTWWLSTSSTGVSDQEEKAVVYAGPVPAADHLRVFGLPVGLFNYEIINAQGCGVQRGVYDQQISLRIPSGFYLMKIYNGHQSFLLKFIKE